MRFLLPRLLGAATAAFGAGLVARPDLLLTLSGMRADDPDLRTFTRALGVRDLASGVAMVAAPSRKAMRVALGVRVASDLGDLVVLGRALAGKPERKVVVAVAGGWALVCGLSALTTRR
jgi:hypothetical protein